MHAEHLLQEIFSSAAPRLNSRNGQPWRHCHQTKGAKSAALIAPAAHGQGVSSQRRWGVSSSPAPRPMTNQDMLTLLSSPRPTTPPSTSQSRRSAPFNRRSKSQAAAAQRAWSMGFIE
jgi:hypothetical protein